ncbi:VTC domain-containing protein [Lineolata rhizophorae]|uniref:VTC domain-containing protein n=1 Tax=Lineolata rhizophorae TaxID=578093 RepID=A0A6A6PEJ6_9PEZI|nr:VTC domain-containing protein [Lineolata rhizophorae]
MRFGRTLRKSIYPPWKDKYIDYEQLKKLLREDGSEPGTPGDEDEWTEDDEARFVALLVNDQLEKVHDFQVDTYAKLRERSAKCESRLDAVLMTMKSQEDEGERGPEEEGADAGQQKRRKLEPSTEETLKEVLKELDGITKEVNELEKYARINYTGFLKAAKKHDKKTMKYRVTPLLKVRLAALPFNKEDYSPLLYRLSTMYSFVRQNLDGRQAGLSFGENQTAGESFTSHKFWVHMDNLLEVKTVILRRLPVLVYNPQTSKVVEGNQPDPTITSIYFDNKSFSLYTAKVDHQPDAASLRLRWFGQLSEKPEIMLEKKVIKEGDISEEQRFPIKEKYIEPFIKGEYKMEKQIQKLQDRAGEDSDQVVQFQKSVDDIQSFIQEDGLKPALRANYKRTAFQIPGDDRVRISLDTELALIREDDLDEERPCRDPDDWHRRDIDDNDLEFPFTGIRKGEINRFPYALLEIKIKGNKRYEWVSELMSSHLVKEAPRFSKFVHGAAVLFEDYVNTLPFWISDLEGDIRRDPHRAFEEEQERRARAAEDEFAVGSLLTGSGTRASPGGGGGGPPASFKPAVASPVGSPARGSPARDPASMGKATPDMTRSATASRSSVAVVVAGKQQRGEETALDESDSDDDGQQGQRDGGVSGARGGLRALFPSFSTSKYARAHRKRRGVGRLPPGVQEPGTWIKDRGPVRVEAKVWLANQRTFVKWQHVAVLLASLSLGLYNAAGETNNVARSLAVVYTAVAAFTAAWGWGMYVWRSHLIEVRSGKDFDNALGPVVVCVGLVVALCCNFGFKVRRSSVVFCLFGRVRTLLG